MTTAGGHLPVASNVTADPAVPVAAPVPDDDRDPVPVFLTNATMTSAGPGPGVKMLPPAEAGRLVTAKLAVHGETPPRGWPG